MVLAAGLGERMRPLTLELPKPLLAVHGRTLLDHTIDRFAAAGTTEVVVNAHYLADQVVAHLARRRAPKVVVSREETLLDTGGGVAHALAHLGTDPFFVANSDGLWLDGPTPALNRLDAAWDSKAMDALLLVHETVEAHGYEGPGDFAVDPLGRVRRRREREIAPYVFTGLQILRPEAFAGLAGRFSLNAVYDRAIADGRLYALVHDGEWFHVGTPDALAATERFFAVRYPGNRRR